MAVGEDNTQKPDLTVVGGGNSQSTLDEEKRGRDYMRRMHYKCVDELIEQALDLLSFLELFAHLDDREAGKHFPVDGTAVATAASTIVKKLRDAQKHHREVLP